MLRATGTAAPRIRTRGQAEEMGTKLMAIGACTMGVGLLLCLTIVLVWLGVPLLILGALIILGDIGWLFRFMKQPSVEVTCPYCHTRNVVLAGVPRFECDGCRRGLNRSGHGAAVDPAVPAA